MTGAELKAFARMVRNWFRCVGASYDLDDLEQDAALAVLEAEARVGLPLEGNRTYYFRAAKCDAGLAMAKRVSAVSVTEWAVRGGAAGWKAGSGGWPWGNRVPVSGCGRWDVELEHPEGFAPDPFAKKRARVDLPGSLRGDERLALPEEETARERLLGILEERIEELPRRDRRPLRLILGLAGREPVEPARAAKLARRSRAAVTASTKRLASAVRTDGDAVEARRVTSGR